MLIRWTNLAVVGFLLALACGVQGQEKISKDSSPSRPLRVVATIAPLAGLTKPLLEQAKVPADIVTLIPPGVSEHGYEIPPSKLQALAQADVVVLIGLGMEPQVEKFLRDRPSETRKVVIAADAAGIKGECDHDHGDEESHEEHHHAVDPHVWLDPVLAESIVKAIAKALRETEKGNTEAVQRLDAAEADLLARVREVDAEYKAVMAKAKRKTIVVGHDAWGYIEKRYGIEAVAIKGLTASEPTPSGLADAMRAIRERGATCVFVEPQLSRQAGEKIAKATGVPVRTLDPLGDGDWFAMMRGNLQKIAAGLGGEEQPKK
jgi:zinc transport system substrate-binding protein